jgi:hypothetical protein
MATLGVETPMYYKAAMAGLGDSQKKINAANEEQAKKLASKDPTRAVAGLDQTLTEVQNSFKKSLIESKVLDATAVAMTKAGSAAEVAANKFAGMTTTEKLGTVLGIEFARVVGPLIAGYLAGKGIEKVGTAIDNRALSKAELKAENEKLAKMDPADRAKIEDLKRSEAENLKKAKAAADDAKGGMAKQTINFFKGLGGKALALVTVGGGATYAVFHYDLAGKLVEGAAGAESGEQPKPLSIEQQRERDKLTTPGAEISKASADTAATPPASTVANTNTVSKLNEDVTALKASLKEIDYSKLMFPDAVGTSIESGSIKLKNLSDSINVTTTAFKDLNNVSLEKLNDSITKLSDAMNKPTGSAAKETTKVGAKTSEDLLTEMLGKLDQLNMSMATVADGQSSAVDYLSKTAKYTRQTSNNSA